jgi:HK97 gp10 family phage protein
MAVVNRAGGPGGRGPFRYSWQGATVQQAWLAQVKQGMDDEAAEILAALRSEIHIDTGEMRRQAFAVVIVAGTKRTLRAGSDVPYAAFEELGTIYRAGHPQIRKVFDAHQKHVTEKIRAARKGR